MKLSGKAPEPEAWWDKLWGSVQHGFARIASAFV
jgi:hypothetical protein